jgi:shikimate kinase
MNLKLKQTPGIYLVGFMGSGKSTVGRHLAERLGWSFFDIDSEIEEAEQQPIALIFATRGEPEFRRIETEAIRRRTASVELGRPAVVALGGGAFTIESNRKLLENNGVTVWLDCPFEIVARRVAGDAGRPLAQDPVRFAALYQSRMEGYRLAHIHIAIESDDPAATVEAILAHPLLK